MIRYCSNAALIVIAFSFITQNRLAAVDFLYATLQNNKLARWDVSSGNTATIEASMTTYDFGFNAPQDLVFDNNGYLYVANYQNNVINKISPFGEVSQLNVSVTNPVGLALDPLGNLYVTDNGGARIVQISQDGTERTYSYPVYNPLDIITSSNGTLYVTNGGSWGSSYIGYINSLGGYITFASGFNNPRGMALDNAGNLYVANVTTNSISKVGPSGGTASSWAFGFSGPIGITFGSNGKLFVANQNSKTISRVNTFGAIDMTFSTGSSAPVFLSFGQEIVPEPSTLLYGLACILVVIALNFLRNPQLKKNVVQAISD